MHNWIHKYPGVQAVLQQDAETLDDLPDGADSEGPWRGAEAVVHEGRLYFVRSEDVAHGVVERENRW